MHFPRKYDTSLARSSFPSLTHTQSRVLRIDARGQPADA